MTPTCRTLNALTENTDERVKGMAAWAMGRMGNTDTRSLLKTYAKNNTGTVLKEIELAIQSLEDKNLDQGSR